MSFLHALVVVAVAIVGLIVCAAIAEWAKSRTVFVASCLVVGLAGGTLLAHLNL